MLIENSVLFSNLQFRHHVGSMHAIIFFVVDKETKALDRKPVLVFQNQPQLFI